MISYEPLNSLPKDFQIEWRAGLSKASPTDGGVFSLVSIRRTEPKTFEEQRIVVLVLDENGFPIPNVKVAFSFDTAKYYTIDEAFVWNPPYPHQAFIVPTQGSGQIDHVQGSSVKPGQPGGVTVYICEPHYSSDIVTGMGMLPDHTGVHLTFQLRRTGVVPLMERVKSIENRLTAMEITQASKAES